MKLTKEEVLVKDYDWQIENVIRYADYLVYSSHWLVCRHVVIHGNDTHRGILVHDKDWTVREYVAIYGNDTHRGILVHDKDWTVRDIAEEYMGATYYKVETNFGTYNGILSLWVWEDKYEIESGCYKTDNLQEWFTKCKNQIETETATKYMKIMEDIIGGN